MVGEWQCRPWGPPLARFAGPETGPLRQGTCPASFGFPSSGRRPSVAVGVVGYDAEVGRPGVLGLGWLQGAVHQPPLDELADGGRTAGESVVEAPRIDRLELIEIEHQLDPFAALLGSIWHGIPLPLDEPLDLP